jgi:hypothetical protein
MLTSATQLAGLSAGPAIASYAVANGAGVVTVTYVSAGLFLLAAAIILTLTVIGRFARVNHARGCKQPDVEY